jgi:N-acetylglutamate synthase-like GNAT family acetyltransferase
MDERTPPTRIRITRLQEAQLADLVAIDAACAAMLLDAGMAAELLPPRAEPDIARMVRTHDVYVAEADHVVAGYLAWRDEPPKIAHLDWLAIGPEYQRFGIATRLLREMAERCGEAGIAHAVVRCPQKGLWAQAFFGTLGFRAVGGDAPAVVTEWLEQRDAQHGGREPGFNVLWRSTHNLGVKILPGVPLPA